MEQKSIKIMLDDRFMYATMPNGGVIPMQVDTIISNSIETLEQVEVTVTLKSLIPISEFYIIDKRLENRDLLKNKKS